MDNFIVTDTVTIALISMIAAACGGPPHRNETLRNAGGVARTRPTFEQMRESITELSQAVPYLASPTDAAAALAVLGTPLWFDGFTYSNAAEDAQRQRCTQASGTLVTSAELDHFVECASIANWRLGGDDVEEIALAKLPVVFAAQRARLADLAADHRFAYTHFCPAAPGDYWTLFAATTNETGLVVVDTILVSNTADGECRQPGP